MTNTFFFHFFIFVLMTNAETSEEPHFIMELENIE